MKKILVLLIAVNLVLVSCSKGNEPDSTFDEPLPTIKEGRISFKMDDVAISFGNLKLSTSFNDKKNYLFQSMTRDSEGKRFSLNLTIKKKQTGKEAFGVFTLYVGEDEVYTSLTEGLEGNVTANDNAELKANFGGEIRVGDTTKTFTEGVVDVAFE